MESANWLDYPFVEKEVRKVVFSLNKEKALKSYNFYLVMFQECWHMDKEDLSRVWQ